MKHIKMDASYEDVLKNPITKEELDRTLPIYARFIVMVVALRKDNVSNIVDKERKGTTEIYQKMRELEAQVKSLSTIKALLDDNKCVTHDLPLILSSGIGRPCCPKCVDEKRKQQPPAVSHFSCLYTKTFLLLVLLVLSALFYFLVLKDKEPTKHNRTVDPTSVIVTEGELF